MLQREIEFPVCRLGIILLIIRVEYSLLGNDIDPSKNNQKVNAYFYPYHPFRFQ